MRPSLIGVVMRTIDAGLARFRDGMVVLSRAFFAAPRPTRERDGLFARELAEGAEIILPLWHEIDEAFLAAEAPMLLDRLALRDRDRDRDARRAAVAAAAAETGEDELVLRAPPVARPPGRLASPSSRRTASGGMASPRTLRYRESGRGLKR